MSAVLGFEGKVLEEISYEETIELTRKFGNFLREFVPKQSYILLFMDHNIYIPAIILSLKAAGHCFTFISAYASEEEMQKYVETVKIQFIITFNNVESLFENFDLVGNIHLIRQELHLWKFKKLISMTDISTNNLLCIISSSGTTGKKKLIKIEKHCIEQNVISLNKIFNLNSEDVIYFGTSLTFDPSLVELFIALNTKAKLLIVSEKTKMNFQSLYKTLFPTVSEYSTPTFLQMVPSLLRRWSVEQIQFLLNRTQLKVLALGGEPFPIEILEHERSVKLFNLYGITEFSCWATVHEIKADNKVFLGTVLDETFIEVRDNEKIVNEGMGELFIGSETRHCFVDDETEKVIWRSSGDLVKKTKDGIEYIGRTNSWVKRFGHKILLNEIENKVTENTNLPSKCVWVEELSKLLLFISIPSIFQIDKMRILDKLRVKLLHVLSKEEFPDFLDIIAAFPVTINGKLDKSILITVYKESLISMMNDRPGDIFLKLIRKYLGQNFNRMRKFTFLELGGNSILYTLFTNDFKNVLKCELSPKFLSLLLDENIEKCLNYLNTVQLKRQIVHKESKIEENICEAKKLKHSVNAEIIWKFDLQGCVDASPLVFESNGILLIAVGSFGNLFVILNAITGELKFMEQFSDAIGSQAAFSSDLNCIYFGCFNGKLYCINMEENAIEWSYETGNSIKSTPTFCRNNQAVVFGSYDKCLHCIDAKTGTNIWKTHIGESVITAVLPLRSSNELFGTTLLGSCFSVNEDIGNMNWQINMGNPIFSPVLMMDKESLICLDVQGCIHWVNHKTSEKSLAIKIDSEIYSSIILWKQFLVVSSHNGFLHRCEMKARFAPCSSSIKLYLGDAISSSPCIFQYLSMTLIAAVTVKGNLYVVNFTDMKVISHWKCPADVFSTPIYHNHKLYIGCRDDNLYCLSMNSLIHQGN